MKSENFKLCYVSGSFAYFTTRVLEKQWGDDWDDAPYEHNAGSPYEFQDYNKERGDEPWEIVKVCFEAQLETPADIAGSNSRYSVEMINSGAIAWLTSPSWGSGERVSIQAGASIDEFKSLVRKAGGTVYVKEESQ